MEAVCSSRHYLPSSPHGGRTQKNKIVIFTAMNNNSWKRTLLENMMVAQLVKKFLAF
jgi:hypothetical protein